jgi:hypothetical protein
MAYINKLLYSPFFQNKFVLYGSLFLVLITLLRFLANRNFNGIILLTLIGLLMTYFSKNMIIVLLTAFVSVMILDMLHMSGSIEGMKSSSKEGADDTLKKDDKDSSNDDDDDDDAKKADEGKSSSSSSTAKKADEDSSSSSTAKKDDKVATQDSGSSDGTKSKNGSSKQGMTKLSPASYDGKDHDSEKTSNNGNRIDYASTLEQAYDNIENIIGEDGVRGLTDQTKSLMNQQKQLMENMKDMGPLLKSAEGFMKQISGGGGIGGITEMLKGFASPAKAK